VPRPPKDRFLAFDIGASGGRAISATLEGGKLSAREIRRFPNGMTRIDGRCHWDVTRLFGEVKRGMSDAVRQGEIPLSVGIDTWGVDYGLLDGAGRLLGLPYAYRDRRTDGAMEEVFEIIPREDIYALTGIQFLQFNTLFQLWAAARDRLPSMPAARDLLFMPDLLNYLLTGVKASEYTCASTSQLMDPRTGRWAPRLFDAIGVPAGIMQEIVPPGTVLGKPARPVAAETGLGGADIVAVASHDTGSAVAAVPAVDDAFAYISSGTWSLMGIESRAPIITPKSLELNFTNEGGIAGTVRILKNIMGLWLLEQCRQSWAAGGADVPLEALLPAAAASKPFRSLVDPDHPRLLHPDSMPEALSGLARGAGEPVPDTPGAFARCILESLALRYRQTLEELGQISGAAIRTIHIIGGGSQNELLCRFTAGATGLPVVAGPAEATALGNIMVQAMARGRIRTPGEIRQVLRASFELGQYLPEDTPVWDAQYRRFLDVCRRTGE